MDRYVTGSVIRRLREAKKLTQEELAAEIFVTGKAVSKWETGQGFPDISLLEPLAKALGISVIELLSGEDVRNRNRASNMYRCRFYVCPACGNAIVSTGEALVSCCGITLPPIEAEEPDADHAPDVVRSEDEYAVSIDHPMTKEHYISFFAAVSDRGVRLVKLYPEEGAQARFGIGETRQLYDYCNRHGLFRQKAEILQKLAGQLAAHTDHR